MKYLAIMLALGFAGNTAALVISQQTPDISVLCQVGQEQLEYLESMDPGALPSEEQVILTKALEACTQENL